MKITEMIKKLGGNKATIARANGITPQSLSNMVAQDKEVLELKDGRYIVINEFTRIFKAS